MGIVAMIFLIMGGGGWGNAGFISSTVLQPPKGWCPRVLLHGILCYSAPYNAGFTRF